jgi:hypothetical protein
MRDYPSRKLQLAWSVMKGYITPTEFTSDLLFQSILSRQGERWQCFGECPEDLTDVMILCREMMVKRGFGQKIIKEFKAELANKQEHLIETSRAALEEWQKNIPTDEQSTTFLLLDDATAAYTYESSKSLGNYFKEQGISFYPEIKPVFTGWEYFVYGLIDEGISHIEEMIKKLKEKNIKTIMTLSGQAEYILNEYLQKLPVEQPFEVINVLDQCKALKVNRPSYLYAGSFNLRYLNKAEKLNKLVINSKEEKIKNCPEFTPLLNGDKRVNILNYWQKPIGAEYYLMGFDDNILSAIEADAVEDIKKSTFEQVVVFDPYAYATLKNKMGKESIVYYFDLL